MEILRKLIHRSVDTPKFLEKANNLSFGEAAEKNKPVSTEDEDGLGHPTPARSVPTVTDFTLSQNPSRLSTFVKAKAEQFLFQNK